MSSSTSKAFERYTGLFETKWKQSAASPRFLWMDGNPAERARAHDGETLIAPRRTTDSDADIRIPGGMIQDWLGSIFLPDVNLAQVRSIMEDYKNYQSYFKPEVIQSKLLNHRGNQYEVFLRLYKKHVLTVVLNSTYSIHYEAPGPARLKIVSRSTHLAEVKDPNLPSEQELPPGKDNGFLWALNSYWRFEEADGGVYAECEAISLSRDVPFRLGWVIQGFLDKFPKDSMENTLAGLKRAVKAGAAGQL